MKRLFSLILASVMLCTALRPTVSAIPLGGVTETMEISVIASGTCGENLTWEIYDNGSAVIGGNGDMGEWDDTWYSYISNVTSVYLGDGVTSIGDYAFSGMKSLVSVDCNNATSIGEGAFVFCSSLTSVDFGNVESIGYQAFSYCTALGSVDLANVSDIAIMAFDNCVGIASVNFPKVSVIGKSAFYDCSKLSTVHIPESCTYISPGAFHRCYNISEITVHQNNRNYTARDNVLFTKDMSSIVLFPVGNKDITDYTVPGSVTRIEEYAFTFANNLISVVIPESVTLMDNCAFEGCSNLEKAEIYNRSTVFNDTFSECDSLTIYGYEGSTAQAHAEVYDIPFVAFDERGIIAQGVCGENLTWILYEDGELVIDGTGDMYNYTYSEHGPWDEYSSYVKTVNVREGVSSVGNYAFATCLWLRNVNVGSVSSIGECAFSRTGITDFVVPDTVTYLGSHAFSYSGLRTVYIPEQTKMSEFALNGTSYITSITVAEGNPYYSTQDGILFNKNKTLIIKYPPKKTDTFYKVPETVLTLGRNAFQYCSYLSSIDLGSITSIDSDCFYLCTKLTDVTVPDTLKVLGSWAFNECTALEYITLPESVASIGYQAFVDCTSLRRITIPNRSVNFGSDVFKSCPDYLVMRGYAGSTAEAYADRYGIIFEAISERNIIAQGVCGENLTWILYDDGELVIDGTGDMYNYSTASDKAPWFEYRNEIKSVVLGSNVRSIGDYAFHYGRESRSTFYSSPNITSIDFGGVSSIGNMAFFCCSGLTAVAIPFSVTNIGTAPFGNCSALTAITVDGANPYYSSMDGVLFNKSSTVLVQYPSGNPAESYTVPASVNTINEKAFAYSGNLDSVIIPESVTDVNICAFEMCPAIRRIEVHNKNAVLDDPFSECGQALTLYGYAGSTTQDYAEYYNIPFVAFDERGITAQGVCGENLTWILYDDGELTVDGTGDMYNYSNASDKAPWFEYRNEIKSVVLGSDVTGIGDYAFHYGSEDGKYLTSPNIVSVDFGGVTSIGAYAFDRCKGLTLLDFANVSSIGNGAFGECSGIVSIDFAKVSTVGNHAFQNCTRLALIDFSDIVSIGNTAFTGCSALVSAEIPESVEHIGDAAFRLCTGLTFITVAEGNKNYCSVNGVLFNKNKTSLIQYPCGSTAKRYTVPGTVSAISSYAFASCKALSFVDTANTACIESKAFMSCTGLSEINIKNVSVVEEWAFLGCTALSAAEMNVVSRIGSWAFGNCFTLKTVIIRSKNVVFADNVFLDHNADMIIYSYSGSTTESHAEKHGIKFEALEEIPESPIIIKDTEKDKFVIVSETINNEFSQAIKGITPGASCSEILGSCTSSSDSPCTLTVVDADGSSINESTAVKSGYRMQAIQNGEVIYEVILIVKGDVDGDGKSTLCDINYAMSEIRKMIESESQTSTLSADDKVLYLTAADLDNDGDVSDEDVRNLLKSAMSDSVGI